MALDVLGQRRRRAVARLRLWPQGLGDDGVEIAEQTLGRVGQLGSRSCQPAGALGILFTELRHQAGEIATRTRSRQAAAQQTTQHEAQRIDVSGG